MIKFSPGRLFEMSRSRQRSVLRKWALSYLLILIIPIVCFVIVYFSTSQVIMREIISSNSVVLKTAQNTLDNRLHSAEQMATAIMIDERFRDVMLKTNSSQDIIEKQGELISLIYNYRTTSYAIDIFIYIHDLDYGLSTTTANRISLLHEALVHYKDSIIDLDSWRESLLMPTGTARYTVTNLHAYDEFGKAAIVYEKSLMPSMFGSCNSVSLFIALPIMDMAPVLPIHPGTALLLLDEKGQVFGSFGGDFIGLDLAAQIDTETITTYEHQGEAYVCTFMRSEVGPYTYAALTPRNLFWKQNYTIMAITVVGFMSAAVVGLIMTYLLLQHNYTPLKKTVQMLEEKKTGSGGLVTRGKSEYDVIRDHMLELYTRNDDMMNDFTRQRRHLVDRYLHDLLRNGNRHLADEDILESLHIDFGGMLLVPIAVFITNPRDNLLATKGNAKISLAFVIENVLNDLLENQYDSYKTEDDYTVTFLYALSEKGYAAFDTSIDAVLGRLCDFFRDHFNLILRCVVSDPVDHIDKLPGAYHDMNAAYVYQIASSEQSVLRVSQLNEKRIAGAMVVNDYAHLLVEAIAIRATADAMKIVDEFFLELGQADDMFRVQRFNVFALTSALLNMRCDQACGMNTAMIDALLDDQNLAALKETFVRMILFMCQTEDEIRQEDSLSDKVKQAVNRQYADVNLSLTQIAREIKLSPKYVSKLFKIETGQGLLDYINAVRIQKAKERMLHHEEPIQKLAEAVGYSNAKTFRRAFRKIEGINPGQFRG